MPNAYLKDDKNLYPRTTEEFQILKSIPEDDLLHILFLASQVCEASAAGIVICDADGLWVKTAFNCDANEILTCQSLINETLQVEEIRCINYKKEELYGTFATYVGLPLQTKEQVVLGVLCLFKDSKTEISRDQKKALRILANQVIGLVDFNKQKSEFERVRTALEQKYQELEKFASVVSHDIKSPLANIISLTELLKEENKGVLSGETLQYLEFLEESSLSLRNYVDGLLKFYRSEKILQAEEEDVELDLFFHEITKLYTVDPSITISYPAQGTLKRVNRAALSQIFINLISNALKYNSKEDRSVIITFKPSEVYYEFEVRDNGNGIPVKQREKIFELFTTLDLTDRSGNPGSGIGLATVKKLVENMGGEIRVESEEGTGSIFTFKLKR